jgi:2-dehydropantoate 2-reductase
MRICIFGLGAVGGHLAARLAAVGHEVSAVARGEVLAALRREGATLRSGGETVHGRVAASERAEELGPQDAVISTLKANALAGLAAGVEPLLGPGTLVVFAQNGIPWWYAQAIGARPRPPALPRLDPHGALARAVAPERVVGAVIHSSNEMVAPGVIANDSPGRNSLLIGAPDDRTDPRIESLRQTLAAAGIASPPVADIRQAIWRKLVINMTLSILCLLTGRRAVIVRDDERLAALFVRLAKEAKAIAAAHGVDVAEFDPDAFRAQAPDHLPSVRQDYERGRPLELDALLLAPLAFGRAAGLATPNLDAIAALAVRMGADKGLYAE